MKEQLSGLRRRVEQALESASGAQALEALRVQMLGKKGEITALLKSLGSLEPEERRTVGQQVNGIRKYFEEKLEEAKKAAAEKQRTEALSSEAVDVTLPGKSRELGHRNPLSMTLERMNSYFMGLGFSIAEGPHIETAFYNFEALNIPKDHPTRDEQDTFYCSEDIVLRTQTSPVQVRHMEKHKPPIRIISPGKVFRSDDMDATHTPVFYQIEGLVVDKGITLGDLRGILDGFARHMFGEDARTRLRPSFFPFTEPSAEMDIVCHACKGNVPLDGCRVCKDSGWVELVGCGMVHPGVLRVSGIDPDVYTGYAFGMGADRIASALYGITEPRLYYENSMQFLAQF